VVDAGQQIYSSMALRTGKLRPDEDKMCRNFMSMHSGRPVAALTRWGCSGRRGEVQHFSLSTGVSLRATLISCDWLVQARRAGKVLYYGIEGGIQPAHARKLEDQLFALNQAENPTEMNISGWHLHQLKGGLAGHWSLRVNGNWRITFRFEGTDAVLVDYRDYH
jgi:proteic killer suppression protein